MFNNVTHINNIKTIYRKSNTVKSSLKRIYSIFFSNFNSLAVDIYSNALPTIFIKME